MWPDHAYRRWYFMHDVQETRLPITTLSEDEQLFREMVRGFAEEKVKPQVMDMDRAAKIPRELIDQLFALGVMGIELPTVYGGAGGDFFFGIFAVEGFASGGPSGGGCVCVEDNL